MFIINSQFFAILAQNLMMKNFTPCLFACCFLFAVPVFSQVAIDGSFGNNGKVTTAYPIAESEIYKVHTLADGKILTCSTWSQEGISYPAVVRYLSNGLIDEAFGANGIARISMTAEYPEPVDMFVQNDGKILVAGTHEIVRNGGNFAIQRLNADGSFDNSFGANSVVITNFGGYNGARDILVQPDQKILVSGVSNGTPSSGENYSIGRYNPDGSLDDTFGINGKSIIDFSTDTSNASESADKMKLQSDGKIMIAGYSKTAFHENFSMIRLNANGSLDTTFGNLGQFVLNYGGTEEDKFRSLAITPDNKYIAAGSSYNQESRHSKMVFIKLNADGSYDTSFGTNGILAITNQQ